MKALARSVIEAVLILQVAGDDVLSPDSAVRVLESIAHELAGASDDEGNALRTVLGELIEEELAGPYGSTPRPEVVEFYRSFMENLGLEAG
jgi:hypothetical protein